MFQFCRLNLSRYISLGFPKLFCFSCYYHIFSHVRDATTKRNLSVFRNFLSYKIFLRSSLLLLKCLKGAHYCHVYYNILFVLQNFVSNGIGNFVYIIFIFFTFDKITTLIIITWESSDDNYNPGKNDDIIYREQLRIIIYINSSRDSFLHKRSMAGE